MPEGVEIPLRLPLFLPAKVVLAEAPLLEYQQARSFEQFALHIRAVNRSIKTAVIVGFALFINLLNR